MPSRRDTGGRKAPRRPDGTAGPLPDQAEVERAIRTVVERLKPKPRKPGAGSKKPDRKAGPPGRLSLVRSRGEEGA